jgi:protein gp37
MAETTEISWAHSTFNPWIGCTKVSPGCDNCYAATLMDERYGRVKWGAGEPRAMTKTWGQPQRWNRYARDRGEPWRVFCASLADVFDNEVPGEWRRLLGQLIVDTPHLTWMLLTKRIGNVGMALEDFRWEAFPGNVWLGITVVNQDEADRDIPKLLKAPAHIRWLSCEPLLGPLDLNEYLEGHEEAGIVGNCVGYTPPVDWVIVGGESGKSPRPMAPEWARSIRDQCARHEVPFHFKQWGGIRPKAAGHLLDGAECRAFPS